MTRLDRYQLSNQKDDFDKAILHLTESILLQPWSLPEHKLNILLFFFNLAVALYVRSNESKRPGDVSYATKYLRHLRDQPHEMFVFPRHQATSSLVDALAFRVELEAGSVMQNIGEMAVLCRELLNLDMSDFDTARSITLFARAVLLKISPWVPDQPLDQLVDCLRAARKHKPDLREARFALAHCLSCRYCMTFVNDDYEEAASVLDEILTSSSPRDSQDEFIAGVQRIVTTLAMIRSNTH